MSAGPGPAASPAVPSPSWRDEAAALVGLPLSRRELFTDHRGVGLRVSWHPDKGVVVLSLWKDDVCAATFHLPLEDAGRLAGFLASADGAQAAEAADADATVALRVLGRDEG